MVQCDKCTAKAYIETLMKESEEVDYNIPADVNYCFHCGAEL